MLVYVTGGARLRGDWRMASHTPTGLAPDPACVREAVVQVYAARAFAWRGAFSVHTWVAVKPANAEQYMRYEVIGWRLYRGLSPISVSSDRAADAQWFGANPWLLRDVRGAAAEAIIALLPSVVASYPYTDRYQAWPGPNSNTFTAYVGRCVPQLRLAPAVERSWQGLRRQRLDDHAQPPWNRPADLAVRSPGPPGGTARRRGNQPPRPDGWTRPPGPGDQPPWHWTHWQGQASLMRDFPIGSKCMYLRKGASDCTEHPVL